MKKNMGGIDRTIRATIAIAVAILYWQGMISGTLAIILGVVSVAFLLTSFISWCPLYTVLGINTCPAKK